jgi:hypothetical protein
MIANVPDGFEQSYFQIHAKHTSTTLSLLVRMIMNWKGCGSKQLSPNFKVPFWNLPEKP